MLSIVAPSPVSPEPMQEALHTEWPLKQRGSRCVPPSQKVHSELAKFLRDGMRGGLGPIGRYGPIGGSSEMPINGNQEALGNIIMALVHGRFPL